MMATVGHLTVFLSHLDQYMPELSSCDYFLSLLIIYLCTSNATNALTC